MVKNAATRLAVQCLSGRERYLRNERDPVCIIGWHLVDLS